MRTFIALIFGSLLVLSSGCDYAKNHKYKGKTFIIRTEIHQGDGVEILTWSNANRVVFNSEEYQYDFYVNGKLVTLVPRGATILEEQ